MTGARVTTIAVGGQPLTLLPEKAAFLPASRTLLVADAHIGKAVTFRALGVPVPRGTTSFDRTASVSLVVPRAHAASTLGAVARWRRAHASLSLVLVRGNHDDRAGDPPSHLGIEVVDEPHAQDGFALCHHPRPQRGSYVLAGHLHPCVGIGGRGFDHLRLPCFWLGDDVGVLPAFGAFTGMHPIQAAPNDRVFAVADDTIASLQPRAPMPVTERRAA